MLYKIILKFNLIYIRHINMEINISVTAMKAAKAEMQQACS